MLFITVWGFVFWRSIMKAKRSFKTVRLNVAGNRYLRSLDYQEAVFKPLVTAGSNCVPAVTRMTNGKTVSRSWSFEKPTMGK